MTQKILLYYKFTPVKDPEMLRLWQKSLCDSLNLRGRILVSTQGINGTVGGELDDLKAYVKATKQSPGFKDIVWKWSDGGRENFPRMSVKVKKELVAFETWDEIAIDERGVVGATLGDAAFEDSGARRRSGQRSALRHRYT